METLTIQFIFLILLGLTFVVLAVFAVFEEYCDRNPNSSHFSATVAAIVLLFVFYPMMIAPVGRLSNGGPIGLGALFIATGLSWSAFTRNHRARWIRRLIQLPITALVTITTVHDSICQCLAKGWFQN